MSLPYPDCLNPPWGISEASGRWSFTQTVPKRNPRAAFISRATSRVHTLPRRRRSAALAGAGLDHHLVVVHGQLAHAGGRDCDAVFVRLDLGRYTHPHPPTASRVSI